MARNFVWPPSGESVLVRFDLDGTTTTVFQDTAVPANSTPFPVTVLDIAGAVAFATEVTQLQVLSRLSGKTVVQTVRLSYTGTPVNTTNWTELVASLPAAVNEISVFDSSGQSLEIGVGAATAEVRRFLVYPGGNGREPIAFASGERVSIRAISANATEGEILINFYS